MPRRLERLVVGTPLSIRLNHFPPLTPLLQRRQHALVPHRGFHPRPISALGLCALCSLLGHYRRLAFALPRCRLTLLPSCLPSLGAALLSALLAAPRRCGTMKALTPAPLTYGAGLPTYLATPSCRSVSNHAGCLNIASPPRQRVQRVSDFAMNEQARRSSPPNRVRSSYGPTVRLRLLSTPPRGDAVTFGYGVVAFSDTDFHRADVAPLSGRTPSGERRHPGDDKAWLPPELTGTG